jgi:hypothetical protein
MEPYHVSLKHASHQTKSSLGNTVTRIGLLDTVRLRIWKLVTQHLRPINYLDKNSGTLATVP